MCGRSLRSPPSSCRSQRGHGRRRRGDNGGVGEFRHGPGVGSPCRRRADRHADGSTPDDEREAPSGSSTGKRAKSAIFDAGTGEGLARQPTGAGAHDVTISEVAHKSVRHQRERGHHIDRVDRPTRCDQGRARPEATPRRGQPRRRHGRGRPLRHERRCADRYRDPDEPRTTPPAPTLPRPPTAYTCSTTRSTSPTRPATK